MSIRRTLTTALMIAALPFHWCVATEAHPELTPYGAIYAGNADDSIPRWQGSAVSPKEMDKAISNSSPLYQINHSTLKRYKAILPHGLVALINKYPKTMALDVYPSLRTANYPLWVYEAAAKNTSTAKEVDNIVTDTYPAPPFIHTRQANRIVWNHLLAYKGVFTELRTREITRGNPETYVTFNNTVSLYVTYYNPTREPSSVNQSYIYYLSKIRSPSRYAGGMLLVHEQVNASIIPRQAWSYLAGQKRVIRIPGVDFDSPMQISESIRFADEINLFNGSIDHYNWKTNGKKEMVVPYNNLYLSEKLKTSDFEDKNLITKHHLNPNYLRYEKHRVWVVEGILKTGKRHAYKKRVFYIDEDSWLILVSENYDKNDLLWRVGISYTKQYHNLPGVFTTADVFHDLNDEIYFFQGIESLKAKMVLPPKASFMPSALRRRGIR